MGAQSWDGVGEDLEPGLGAESEEDALVGDSLLRLIGKYIIFQNH